MVPETLTAEKLRDIADNYESYARAWVQQTDLDGNLGVTEKSELACLRAWADVLESAATPPTPPTREEVAQELGRVRSIQAAFQPQVFHDPEAQQLADVDALVARGWLAVSDSEEN